MNKLKRTKGFTIIEVVLVLAIAGLIFMMVFVALPALQRAQKDTETKNNVSVIAAGIVTYVSNNSGVFPLATSITTSNLTSGLGAYISEVFRSNTSLVTVKTAAVPIGGTLVSPVSVGEVTVVKGTKCGLESVVGGVITRNLSQDNSPRSYSIVAHLEAGGGSSYCQSY